MSDEKMREGFEAWVETQIWTIDMLWRDGYVQWEAQFAFDAWQASRAAIEIELPNPDHLSDDEASSAIYRCVEAIESAGVKCK